MFATIIGVRFMKGTSKKNGREFEMTRAVLLRPVESFKTSNIDIQAIGYEAAEVAMTEDCFKLVRDQKLPLQCELILDQRVGREGIETTITGFRTPAPLKSAQSAQNV